MSKLNSIGGLSIFVLVSLLSGCASTPPVSTLANETELKAVEDGNQALVIMSNSGQSCETTTFGFTNLATDKTTYAKIVQSRARSGFSVGQPTLFTLDPGTYKLTSGRCTNHQYQPLVYSTIGKWFEPFEVEGGDVRNLGNLNVSAAKGEGRRGLAVAAVTRVLSLGRNTNNPRDYLVLRFVDAPLAAKRALEKNYPSLVGEFKSDPPKAKINAREFREIFAEAYSPDEDGKAPMKSDADDIVQDFMDSID